MKKLSDMTLEELWRLFPVFLTAHDPHWAEVFRKECVCLKTILPDAALINHIGSTSISGIAAKPIIDMLAEIPHTCDIRETAEILKNSAGYTIMSEAETRISLNKGYTENGFAENVFHLHLRYLGDNDEIYFRDYLNSHLDTAKKYEDLKLGLWKKYEFDRDGYTAAKTEFVKHYTELAKRALNRANKNNGDGEQHSE